ncbi:DUF4902 domain-containing protein [Caenimonas sedimenti]|nr:DUF4902 domain-containing protein [Caenimonas sedimenti]
MYSITADVTYPQMHSHDRRVRLREAALLSIVFEHVCTVQDPGVLEDARLARCAVQSAGITEWQGRSQGRLVSLGWDWMRLHDGALRAQTSVPPRSNITLIDSGGYDMSRHDTDEALIQLILDLPWEEVSADAVSAE